MNDIKKSFNSLENFNIFNSIGEYGRNLFAKKKLTKVSEEETITKYYLREWVPEYYGVSLSGTAIVGIGYTGQLSLGYMPSDGLFFNVSLGTGTGFDLSLDGVLSIGQYKGYNGSQVLRANTLSGASRGWNAGARFLSIGNQQSFDTDMFGATTLTNWNMYSGGLSFGSKSFWSGNINSVKTSKPIYLYRHNH